MTIDYSSHESLISENSRLKKELEELRDLIATVRANKCDGLVIHTAQGDKVFTLENTDQTIHTLLNQATESQRKFQDLVETTSDFIWEMDPQGRYTYCSPQMEKLWGIKPSDMVGKTPFDLMPLEDKKKAIDYFVATVNPPKPFGGLETVAIVSQGRKVFIETNGVPFFDNNGNLLGYRGISRDITERKQFEIAFREAAEKYSALFNNTSDGIWTNDLTGIILEVNDAYCLMSGYSRDELIHMPVSKLEAKETSVEVAEHIKKLIKIGGHERFESKHQRKDGSTFDVDITAFYVEKENKIAIFTRDITERRKAEDALRYNNERLKLLSEITSNLLSSFNPQGIIQEMCERTMSFLNCDVFFNFLLDEEKERLHLNAYAGVSAETAKTFEWLSLGEAVCGCAAQGGKRIVCENIPDSQDHRAALVRSFGVKAYCANPIFSDGKVIGTLSFGTRKKPFFDDEELSVMKTVTAQVSVAMQRKKSETKVQQLLETVQRERDKLSSLVNSMSDEVWFADTEGKFTLTNPSALKEFNLKPSDPRIDVGAFVKSLEIYHVDGTPRSPNEAQPLRSLRGEVIENEEEIVKNPITGELRYRQISSAPVRNAEGIIIGSVSVVRDVTEHKKAEKEIESLAKFPNENPAAVLRVEQKGTILFANPQAQLFLKEWQTKVGESVPEHVRQAIVSSLASGTRTEFEETLGEQTFSFLTAPIATAGYANLYGRNITKRKKAEAKLEEYTKHLEELVKERTEKLESSVKYNRSLIEASLDPLVTISVDGKITDVNKATEEATGYTRQELVGSDFSEYFTEPEKARTGYTKVFTDSFVIDYPLALKHKNGKVTDVLYNATVYRNENGEIQGVFAAARDVTERKKAEEQLKNYQEHLEQLVAERTEKLKRNEWIARERARELEKMQVQLEEKSVEVEEYANNMESLAEERLAKLKDAEHLAAIGATAGMVGHDIRNPLQAIVGDLYLISTDAASLHESEIKESIEESVSSIYKNVDYINKIIQDLQDYSRQLAPTKEIVDLEELCKEVVSKGGIPKNITVSCHITQATKRIVSDSNLLTRILSNLFSNAVQAMSKGGKLKIEAYRQAGDTVVTVEDTGGGIPEDVRPKLFTPLFTTKSKGQGFGLPVVKRMTEALNGSVTYESEVGKGTKFFVRLPPQKEPAKTNTISN